MILVLHNHESIIGIVENQTVQTQNSCQDFDAQVIKDDCEIIIIVWGDVGVNIVNIHFIIIDWVENDSQNTRGGWQVNMNWTKKLSLFGGNWKSLIFKISIGINDYTHKNSKNQVDLIFQLFVYILQQF